MTTLFDLYKSKGFIAKDRNCYKIKSKDSDPIKLGQTPEKAETVIESLIQEGKIQDLRYVSPSGSDDVHETSQQDNTGQSVEVEPETPSKGPEKVKPTDTGNNDLTDIERAEQLMASKLGDISKRGKHGRFNVFINGIDQRKKRHPVVKAHPYVYRHCIAKKNVRSGDTVTNNGYTVFTKEMNPIDPRTNKPRITVQRDDTPDGPFYTVGENVLCYASKAQFEQRKAEQVLANTIKTAKELDSRQEKSERAAKMDDAAGSLDAYSQDIQAVRAVTSEKFESQGLSKQEAQDKIDSIEAQISRAKSGQTDFKTVRGQRSVNMNSI